MTTIVLTLACQRDEGAGEATNGDGTPSSTVPWSEGAGWQVSAEPVLSIGREDDAAELRFNRIRRIVTLPGGDILVVNGGGPPGLRIFSSAGEVVAGSGGQGAGPGEFGILFDGWFVAPDTIVTFDYRHYRASWFLTNGDHIRDELLAHLMAQQMIVRGRYADGSWLLASNAPEYEDRSAGRVTLRMLAHGAADGSSIDSIGYSDEMTRRESGEGFRTPAFMPGVGTYVAIGDRLYTGYPDAYEIEVRSPDGAILHTVRRDDAGRALTDEIFDAVVEARVDAAAPDQRARVRRDLMGLDRPDHLPAFSGSLAEDSDGNLWVQEFALPWDASVAWSVFNDEGAYLGDVHLPARFTPMEITRERLLGVWRNEFDVETVRAYELTRRR